MPSSSSVKRGLIKTIAACGLILLAACSSGQAPLDADGVYDPYEKQNRKIHAFNRGLDRSLVRPAALGYSTILPDEVEDSIGNFASNLGQPSVAVNSLLQGDLKGAAVSTTRFLTNTVFGFAGFADVARELQIPEHNTDFGETLFKWGVREGPYVELPALGPSTARAATGKFVDIFTNPISYLLNSPERYYGTGAGLASRLSDRGRFADTLDSILYDSADSYAQARLIYLQNRRFGLGDETVNDSTDPYSDPYEDPNAQ